MGNFALGWPNRIDTATVTASSSVGSLPVTNLQDKRIARVWRSGNCTGGSITIDIDLGATTTLQAVSMHNVNFSSSATFQVTAGPTIGSSSAMDSGALSAVRMSLDASSLIWEDAGWWEGAGSEWLRNTHPVIYLHPSVVAARWVRITITDTGNSDAFVQVGRVFCGPVLIPVRNDIYPRVSGFSDLTEFAMPGARFARQGRKRKRAELSLARCSVSEVRYLRGISRQDGTDADVLYLPSSTDAAAQQEFGFLGTITDGLSGLSQTGVDYYAGRLVLEERL